MKPIGGTFVITVLVTTVILIACACAYDLGVKHEAHKWADLQAERDKLMMNCDALERAVGRLPKITNDGD